MTFEDIKKIAGIDGTILGTQGWGRMPNTPSINTCEKLVKQGKLEYIKHARVGRVYKLKS